MNADLSELADLLLTIAKWFKDTYITFGGISMSLWSVFVSGSAVAIITKVLYEKGDQNDD